MILVDYNIGYIITSIINLKTICCGRSDINSIKNKLHQKTSGSYIRKKDSFCCQRYELATSEEVRPVGINRIHHANHQTTHATDKVTDIVGGATAMYVVWEKRIRAPHRTHAVLRICFSRGLAIRAAYYIINIFFSYHKLKIHNKVIHDHARMSL